MQEWQDIAILLRRLTPGDELDHGAGTRFIPPTSNPRLAEHTKTLRPSLPPEICADTFEHSPPCGQGPLLSSPPPPCDPATQLPRPGFLPRVAAMSGHPARHGTWHPRCRDPRVDTGRGMFLGPAPACHGNNQMAAHIFQPPQSTSALWLWGKDETHGPNTPTVDPAFHWPSEQVFYRTPAIIPYDSPLFDRVQNGDIAGVRELWRRGQASVDVVDPYGLGLLYVRSAFASGSWG
jgi:hypothetical protein